MRSLRAKLFVSVGIIFILVALINFFLPEIFLKRDLKKASVYLNNRLEKVQKKIEEIASLIIALRYVSMPTELKGTSKLLQKALASEKELSWTLAAKIASYNPQIAFTELKNDLKSVLVTPQEATLYTPLWSPFEQGMLWIELSEKKDIFLAVPIQEKSVSYLLFKITDLEQAQFAGYPQDIKEKIKFANRHKDKVGYNFQNFEREETHAPVTLSVDTLHQFLNAKENQWVKKMEMIVDLASWKDQNLSLYPSGLLKTDVSLQKGNCILSNEVFRKSDLKSQVTEAPFLLVRQYNGKEDLDLALFSLWPHGIMGLGYSLSDLIQNTARFLQRPVMLLEKNRFLQGYTENGQPFEGKELYPNNLKNWNLDCAKASGLSDRKSVNITNIDRLAIAQSRELSRQPKSNFSSCLGIKKEGALLSLRGKKFAFTEIPIGRVTLVILTPESEKLALTKFLTKLKLELQENISFALLGGTLFSFIVALILLGRISKKITKPVSQLAFAAREISDGKYENLILPPIEKRKDEVSTLTHSFEKMVISLKEREKIRGVLNKVVSKEVARELLKSEIELQGEERVVTILFSDIRGFTHISEHLEPKTLIALLNAYMTEMCLIIDETKGVVDKFVGDEIMALYGAPLPLENQAARAIEAALLMKKRLERWNEERKKAHEPTFKIGIGIHTGKVYVGNMGAENRLNYTAVGANVNLASRLCSIAKPMQILISDETWQIKEIQEKFRFQKLDPVSLKGIDHPVAIYEAL